LTLSKSFRSTLEEEYHSEQKEVEKLKKEKNELLQERENLKQEMKNIQSSQSNQEMFRAQFQNEIQEKNEKIKKLQETEIYLDERIRNFDRKLIEVKDYYEKKIKKMENEKKSENSQVEELKEVLELQDQRIQQLQQLEESYQKEIVDLKNQTQSALQNLSKKSKDTNELQYNVEQLNAQFTIEMKREKDNSMILLQKLNKLKEDFDKNEEIIQSFKLTLTHANEEIRILEAAQKEFENVNKQKFKQLRSELFEKQKHNMMLISQLEKISSSDVKNFENSVDQQLKQFSNSSEEILDDYQKKTFEYESTINKLKTDLQMASQEIQILESAQIEYEKANKKTIKNVKSELNQNLQEKKVYERFTQKERENISALQQYLEISMQEIKILESAQLEFQTVTKMQFKKLKTQLNELKNQNQILNSLQNSKVQDDEKLNYLFKQNQILKDQNDDLTTKLKQQTKKNANDYYTQFADNLAQDKQKLSDELKIERLESEKLKMEFNSFKSKASKKIKSYEEEIEILKKDGNMKSEMKKITSQKQLFQLLALILPLIAALFVYFMK
jgi:DNA repair exonuclease SbcCD ATPase subunit